MIEQADHISDRDLMVRVAGGDVAAFEAIHRRYQKPVLALAARLTKRPVAAEEIAQDAFVSLWRSAWRYDESRGNLSTWLLSLVRNRGIDSLRREARHEYSVEFDDALVDRLEAPARTEEEVVARDEARQLRALLTDLPSEQGEVIDLVFFRGLTHTEIASTFEIPLGTVKGRQRLALVKLRRTLVGERQSFAT